MDVLNNSQNHIEKRRLSLICNNHVQSFEKLFKVANDKIAYQKNLESLTKEIFKFLCSLSSHNLNYSF